MFLCYNKMSVVFWNTKNIGVLKYFSTEDLLLTPYSAVSS